MAPKRSNPRRSAIKLPPPRRQHPLKIFRHAHGLNQREAARLFGISQAAWSRYERGEHRPGRELAKRLIKETGISSDVLMGIAS